MWCDRLKSVKLNPKTIAEQWTNISVSQAIYKRVRQYFYYILNFRQKSYMIFVCLSALQTKFSQNMCYVSSVTWRTNSVQRTLIYHVLYFIPMLITLNESCRDIVA